jgi:hypothetical protein
MVCHPSFSTLRGSSRSAPPGSHIVITSRPRGSIPINLWGSSYLVSGLEGYGAVARAHIDREAMNRLLTTCRSESLTQRAAPEIPGEGKPGVWAP